MKSFLPLYLTLFSFFQIGFAQSPENKQEIKYFDPNYDPLTKEEFQYLLYNYPFLDVVGDSSHHMILVERKEGGIIKNMTLFDRILEEAVGQQFDASLPVVAIFYPGKDPCNSSGRATNRTMKKWYNEMERLIQKVHKANVIYVYADDKGLARRTGDRNWIEDPENLFRSSFFQRHYPCSSYVIITEEGQYSAYFGEFSKEGLVATFQELLKN
ncbi:hypothetical protein [Portibacter marinus]|uniref:hypothetical protein n=1 Tax=Portibacter marinus TaxID=2898660 RepID=UPI001F254C30|nr:hypothetical protein [Portibacter marinus]